MSLKALISGDRDWSDEAMIENVIRYFNPTEICHGAAAGADSIGHAVCMAMGISSTPFPAKWRQFGRAAGPIRNEQMAREFKPDLVLAFHTNIAASKGTKHMLSVAKRLGITSYLFPRDLYLLEE